MRVDTALLCDWATTREGLLHILGGGITRVWREEFPAPLMLALALRITLHRTEAEGEHELRLLLQSEDGTEVAKIEGQFSSTPSPELKPGEELAAVLAMPLPMIALNGPGAYSFEILIDGIHQASVPFRAEYQKDKPE